MKTAREGKIIMADSGTIEVEVSLENRLILLAASASTYLEHDYQKVIALAPEQLRILAGFLTIMAEVKEKK